MNQSSVTITTYQAWNGREWVTRPAPSVLQTTGDGWIPEPPPDPVPVAPCPMVSDGVHLWQYHEGLPGDALTTQCLRCQRWISEAQWQRIIADAATPKQPQPASARVMCTSCQCVYDQLTIAGVLVPRRCPQCRSTWTDPVPTTEQFAADVAALRRTVVGLELRLTQERHTTQRTIETLQEQIKQYREILAPGGDKWGPGRL